MKLYTSLFAFAILTASCTHVYYAPNTANAPLLSEKGETRMNALYSAGGVSEFTGGELQFAHAVSKNFGVMMNGMSVSRTDEVSTWDLDPNWNFASETHTEKGKGSYIEFAGGYFKTLDNKRKWLFETYGGFGIGTANNDYGFGDHSKVNSNKIFIQPSLGYKSKYFEMAFVPKISFINWKMKESNLSNSNNEYLKTDLSTIEEKPHFTSFEPALLLRGGGANFKVQASLSYSKVQSGATYQDLVEDLNASIGISINLKPAKK
jgi:hypothetical protein